MKPFQSSWRLPATIRKTLEEKLEAKFERSVKEQFRKPGTRVAFLWTSVMGKDGVRYGSFKNVHEDELAKREYVMEDVDYDVGIFYTDVLHNPKTYQNEPKGVNGHV